MTTQTKVTIGGSEAAAACGLDPFRSRVQLWLERTGRAPARDMTEQMRWGTILEPIIVRELRDVYGIETGGPEPEYARAATAPEWMSGHPDRFALIEEEDAILEVKTTNAYRSREWGDGVPAGPMLQVQHYLALTGLRLGMVACLIGGQRLVIRRCDRDDQLIAHMLRLEEEFVGFVERDEPPPPDGTEATDKALGLLYPEARDGVVHLTAEDAALVEELRARKRTLKATREDVAEVEQALKMRLGEYQVGVFEGRPLVKWTATHSRLFDVTRFRAEHPEVADAFTVQSSARRFSLVGAR